MSSYAKYIKPRLQNEPEFKEKHSQYMTNYISKLYHKNEEYRKKVNEASKTSHRKRYESDHEYRQHKRQQALDRYYEKKMMNWYTNLFEQDA